MTYIPSDATYFTQEAKKKIFGLGVEISTVFEIFGHFLYQGVQDNSVWS
jgi:hypothetical protein